jgi:hypothetical protein
VKRPSGVAVGPAMSNSLPLSIFRAIRWIFPDQRGASATVLAIALPGLIGFGALGAETGIWFTIKLQNQSAADAAAISAAYEVIAGRTPLISELVRAASEAAARNGYRGSAPTIIYPYSDDIVSNGVAVTLQQTEGAFLAAMFLSGVTVATKAVAVIEVLDNPCLLALGTSGTDVEVADFGHLEAINCSVAANSTSRSAIDLHGSTSSIAATTLVTPGQVSFEGTSIDPAAPPPEFTLASPAQIGAPIVADPYAGTLTHAALIIGMPTLVSCGSRILGYIRVYDGRCVVAGPSLTEPQIRLSAGTRISGPWTIVTGQSVDLSPGTYWVTDGDLTVQSSGVLKCSTCDNVRGRGVTVILTTRGNRIGTVSMAPTATVRLNAPSARRFPGVVLVQDANGLPGGTTYTSNRSTITGSSGATLNGLVYFPNSSMTFQGTPSLTGPRCLLLVVNAATVEGASRLETEGCTSAGLTRLPEVYTAALAE